MIFIPFYVLLHIIHGYNIVKNVYLVCKNRGNSEEQYVYANLLILVYLIMWPKGSIMRVLTEICFEGDL